MDGRERVYGLDIARSWAMLLALMAHVLVQVHQPTPYPPIGLLIRMSTPIFMLLFGAMIALVHLPRLEQRGLWVATRRSLMRAAQCYGLFLANVAALWIAIPYSARYALLCAAMLGSTPYAGILQYYVIMLSALPLLLVLLRRVPLCACMAAAITVHLAYPLLKEVPAPPRLMGQAIWGRLVNLFVGTGTDIEIAGPSILHSLLFLFTGVALGRWVAASPGDRPRAGRMLLAICLLYLVMALWSLSIPGDRVDLAALAGMRLRNLDHPAYFFVVGGLALAVILLCLHMARGRAIAGWMLVLGRRSLFGFGVGNIVITVWPRSIADRIGPYSSAALLLGVVVALIFAYDGMARRRWPAR